MVVYSSIKDFQEELIKSIKLHSDVDFKINVDKKRSLFLFYLNVTESNLEKKIELFFGDNGTFLLQEPIDVYVSRLRLQHLEYLNHCKAQVEAKSQAEETARLESKKREVKAIKENAAANYRQKQDQQDFIDSLMLIAPSVYGSTIDPGEVVIRCWSMGDGEYSLELSLIRICDELNVQDHFDVFLEEITLNYGEYAPTDASYQKEILVHERYDNIDLAVERCKNIILEKGLFSEKRHCE